MIDLIIFVTGSVSGKVFNDCIFFHFFLHCSLVLLLLIILIVLLFTN